jgi:superoxide dismutase
MTLLSSGGLHVLKTTNAVSPMVTGWTPLLTIDVWEVGGVGDKNVWEVAGG